MKIRVTFLIYHLFYLLIVNMRLNHLHLNMNERCEYPNDYIRSSKALVVLVGESQKRWKQQKE